MASDAVADRGFFRVQTRLPVRIRPAPPDADARLIARSASEEPIDASELPSALASWLERLERKLDRVLASVDETHEAPLSQREACAITLSGSGLSLESDRTAQPDSLWIIELQLPGTPSRLVRALGRVVGPGRSGEGTNLLAFAFESIDERDRDLVVAHVNDVQRAQLRRGAARGPGQ